LREVLKVAGLRPNAVDYAGLRRQDTLNASPLALMTAALANPADAAADRP
jgi:hypothetical protein